MVDYAHTPAGLEVALAAARDLAGSGRVICVFGCGGDRDQGKRPEMGAVAVAAGRRRGADLGQPAVGGSRWPSSTRSGPASRAGAEVVVEPDRAEAIRLAVGLAGAGDVVLLAGKGHETTQSWPTGRSPFDDRVEARRALDGPVRGDRRVISLMTSGGVALWVAVLSTPVLIRWLIKNNIGQQIREDGPQVHIAKAGTPTMGGIGIVAAVVIGYLAAHAIPGVHFSRSGAADHAGHRGGGARSASPTTGSRSGTAGAWASTSGPSSGPRSASGVLFSLLAVYWAHASTTLSFTRYDSIGLHMGTGPVGGLGHGDHRRRRPTP